jgi:hypothetical protein
VLAQFLAAVLFELADHGAVTITGTPNTEIHERIQHAPALFGRSEWITYPGGDLTVELTGLARNAIREDLLANGIHAPLTTD